MDYPTIDELKNFFTNMLKNIEPENILITKLSFNLDKVYIKKSKIHGNGLFAKNNINKNDIITFYPCDLLLYYPDKNRDKNNHKVGVLTNEDTNKKLLELFNNNRYIYYDYKYDVNESYSIIGFSEINNNSSYLGHLCNDSVRGHTKKDKEIYENITMLKSNAIFYNICDCIIAVVALKDIKIDEEILVPYGHDYWINPNRQKS